MNRCGSYNCKPRSNLWKHWYTFLLVLTLGIFFFAIFFREPPKVPTKKTK